MDTATQDIPKLEAIYTMDDIVKQIEASGVNLGDDPAKKIGTFIDNGLLPQPKNGRFASFVVQRIIAIQNKLQEGKSISELKDEVSKERRRFLNQVTDLNSMVNLYRKFSNNSLFFLASLLLVAMVSIGILGAGLTGSSNPVIVAGESMVKAVINSGSQIAKTVSAPLGRTLVTIIKTSKPADNSTVDPLGLTNLEEKEFMIPENLVTLNEGGGIELDGSITANNFFGDLLWSSVVERPTVLSAIDGVGNDAGNIDLVAGSGITILSDDDANTITFSSIDNSSSQFIFKNIAVSGQSNIVADLNNDTLTFVAGSNVSLITNASTDTLTIGVTGTISNADTLDLLDSSAFLRSNTADAFTSGTLTFNAGTTLAVSGSLNLPATGISGAGAGSGLDADLLDGLSSTTFLRSNTSDNYTSGTLTFDAGTALIIDGSLSATETITFNKSGGISANGGYQVNQIATFDPSGGGSQYAFKLDITNSPTVATNTPYGLYIGLTDNTALGNTSYGIYADNSLGSNTGGTRTGIYGRGEYQGVKGVGDTYGVYGQGQFFGVVGFGTGGINPGGVYGYGTDYGGYFETGDGGTALYVNLDLSGNIAVFADFDTPRVTIADGGNVTLTSDLAVNGGDITSTASQLILQATGANSDVVIQGGLCIRDATACNDVAAGGLEVDTAGGTGDDPGDVFDIAEIYDAAEPVNQGDVVSATGGQKVKRSSGEYDQAILGIASSHPAALIDDGTFKIGVDPNKFNPNKPWVALAGRVPTNVSVSNGAISPGDPLTSSSIPGVAMKAVKSGPIIGKALEAFQCPETSDQCTGKIMTFISVGWFVAPLETGDGQLATGDLTDINVETLTAGTISTDVLFIGERKISFGKNGALKIDGNVEVDGEILARKISTDELVISSETSGNEVVKAGQKSVAIENDRVRNSSKILVTFNSDYSPATRYWVTKDKGVGFSVHLDQPVTENSTFDWLIIN